MDYAATPQGTRTYQERHKSEDWPDQAYRRLGRTNLMVSAIGFGGYRIHEASEQHRAALRHALRSGINLIDTSTNYMNGQSETLIGSVLQEFFTAGEITREQVVVVSKAGYIQGSNLLAAQEKERAGNAFPEVVKYGENVWHCLHPSFLRDQLTLSLQRLNLKTIDVFLLHNPEYYFMDAIHRGATDDIEALQQEFYQRIQNAFRYLEMEVEQGRIGSYGVSSNTFIGPTRNLDSTSLSTMHGLAQDLGARHFGDSNAHHFSVVQMPFNLFEAGGVTEANNAGFSAIAYARENEIGVLTNRPLNAIIGQELVRLADYPVRSLTVSPEQQIETLQRLEDEFIRTVAPALDDPDLKPSQLFRFGHQLQGMRFEHVSLDAWQATVSQAVTPHVATIIRYVEQRLNGPERERWMDWKPKYLEQLQCLIDVYSNEIRKEAQKRSAMIGERLNTFLPDPLKDEPLAVKVLALLANTDGVDCVLNGMRETRYVDDALRAMPFSFDVDTSLFAAFQQMNQ